GAAHPDHVGRGLTEEPEALLALPQRLLCLLSGGDVDKGDHHALDAVGRAPVGPYSGQVPRPALVARGADIPLWVDAVPLALGSEEVRALHGLGTTEDEQPLGTQGAVKQLEDVTLSVALEVDEEVPATDQVEAREGRIGQEIMRGEGHPFAHLLPYAVAAVLADEEASQSLRTHLRLDVTRIEALA